LIITARRAERLNELAALIRDKFSVLVHPISLDVRNRQQVNEAFANLPNEFRNVDVLVNNAGLVIGMDHIDTVSPEAIDVMIDTNVKGLLNVTQAILPSMKRRDNGHIINISSIAGTEAYPGGGIYCATKHAVDAITRSLRFELVHTQLRVTSIDPGLVETEFSVIRFSGDVDRAKSVYKGLVPLSGLDIAETVVFAASRPAHVQIASMIVFPTNQAAATSVSRKE
jgi:3-hydroxy acid dehydrogenase/malonic semialdehyde reductase